MSQFLDHYHPVHPTTWVYLSSLLMICVFFKFGRIWSCRNLDLILLILLAPGLLCVHLVEEADWRDELDRQRRAVQQAPVGQVVSGSELARAAESSPIAVPDRGPNEVGDETVRAAARGTNAARSEPQDDFNAEATQAGSKMLTVSVSEFEDVIPVERRAAIRFFGFVWLLGVAGLWLIRLLLDPTMVRRPLLEPNLLMGGLLFMGGSLFVFLMANVITSRPTEDDLAGPRGADNLLAGVSDTQQTASFRSQGPGNSLLHLIPNLVTIPSQRNEAANAVPRETGYVKTAKVMAIMSHLAVVIGVVLIGYWHFGNLTTGIGAATLYLLLPYTAMMTGRVIHVLPAALLVWMVLCYRQPLWSGVLAGMAIGVVYYPIFLLPLWISFYWQRGLMRFLGGILSSLVVVALALALVSDSVANYGENLQTMLGIWLPQIEGLKGVWGLNGWDPIYRLPILAAFVAISFGLAIWPAQKNLGTLLSCSAAVMVATQFWHGYGGGLYVAWYLPLTLLTIFRPNLEDRVALSVLGEGWPPRRRRHFTIRAA
jgi:hypothetical protein